MWRAEIELLAGDRVRRVTLTRDGAPLSRAEVAELWRGSATFRAFFDAELAAAPHTAFFWETPPVTRSTLERPYEHVLVDAPAFAALRADPAALARPLASAGEDGIATFENLGRDALLVAPAERGPREVYLHLAAYARGGPAAQRDALWRRVGEAVATRIGDDPVWVSTSGLGVPWLHVRLDSWPKYVTWGPYRAGAD